MRVAILDDYQGVALRMADWRSLLPAAEVQAFTDHLDDLEALAARLRPFQAVVLMRERTPFPRALFERLDGLRLLVTAGMRNASIDLAAATERRVQVSGTDMLPYPTAELTWGLILALFRHIPAEDRAARAGRWQTTLGLGLKGKTLGLVGLGKLGGQVAQVGRAFGMEVIAWSQNLTAERAAEVGARLVPKDDLFAGADVVSIHLVLSPRTRGLVGAAELGRMKPTAFLVNTSRGPILDEAALLAALRARRIAGAALDVFEPEPLPADHPLLALDNTVITPHLGYVTEEGYRLVYGQAVEDIRAFLDGKALRPLNQLPVDVAPLG
ncbi:D-2-hydroxyacid dehydrogenase family protein [Sorangium sp. So ce327]|uniref:D-2-hydroxyacid dehydrogenase family protein n=1 Tax=Sorangium sp. So ce327 TaxID=3133301 RepID=UPI003F5D85B9